VKALFVDLQNLAWDRHGTYALSAALRRAGVEVACVGTRNVRAALDRAVAAAPDLVLYSALASTAVEYAAFDPQLKARLRCVSIVGGPGPTYGWESLPPSTIDLMCFGEGDEAVVEYALRGTVGRNIVPYGAPPPGDYFPFAELDSLPFPDRGVVYGVDPLLRGAPSKQFLSGRGCPYGCTYCFNHRFHRMFRGCGAPVRKKSVGYLLEEIRGVRAAYPLRNLVFQDDTFILDRKWLLEFRERYPAAVGLPFTCNIRADLMDDEVARALKESGCTHVNWSIESGDPELRNGLLRRGMSDGQILATGETLHRHGLRFRIGNVVALPGESVAQMLRTVEMNIRVRPFLAQANIFVPFPGLELTRSAVERGLYRERPQSELPRDFFAETVLEYPEKEKEEIAKLVCLFPYFVAMPFLFRSGRARRALFRLPRRLLRAMYEAIWTWKMSRMYFYGTSLPHKLRMGFRYLRNL
jgi:radical SAM superfamily enzyme YgiQ (UPF0313 family)